MTSCLRSSNLLKNLAGSVLFLMKSKNQIYSPMFSASSRNSSRAAIFPEISSVMNGIQQEDKPVSKYSSIMAPVPFPIPSTFCFPWERAFPLSTWKSSPRILIAAFFNADACSRCHSSRNGQLKRTHLKLVCPSQFSIMSS